MTETKKHRPPEGLEHDALSDALWDLIDFGTTTLPPESDPEQWIYWLQRYQGVDQVSVQSHTETALILKRF